VLLNKNKNINYSALQQLKPTIGTANQLHQSLFFENKYNIKY